MLRSISFVIAAALCGTASQSQAAGGHHAVDDAAILDPGQCQLEVWNDREEGGLRSVFHTGPACRVGPVELGLNLDRSRTDTGGSIVSGGPQLKWAMPLSEHWSTGVVVAATWKSRAPRYVGSSLVVPLTWQASDTLALHANLGRDFRHGERDSFHGGVAAEWSPTQALSFVAERWREGSVHYWRTGLRWTLSPAFNIDLSQARGLHGSARPWWSLGMTWVVDR